MGWFAKSQQRRGSEPWDTRCGFSISCSTLFLDFDVIAEAGDEAIEIFFPGGVGGGLLDGIAAPRQPVDAVGVEQSAVVVHAENIAFDKHVFVVAAGFLVFADAGFDVDDGLAPDTEDAVVEHVVADGAVAHTALLKPGDTIMGLNLNDVNTLQSMGQQEQGQAQREADALYANQYSQYQQPMQELGFYSDIYQGMPTAQSTFMTQQSPSPNPFTQAAGIGLGLYGMSR